MADNDFSFDKAEDSTGFLLWQVTTLWQRGIKKVLDKHNLTHPQYVLLASLLWLSRQKEIVTQIEISAHSKVDPMTTSTVLRTLQTKGFIERQEHVTDTRAKSVVLIENGKRVIKQAIKTVEEFDALFFSLLGRDINDFNKQLLELIRKSQ